MVSVDKFPDVTPTPAHKINNTIRFDSQGYAGKLSGSHPLCRLLIQHLSHKKQ